MSDEIIKKEPWEAWLWKRLNTSRKASNFIIRIKAIQKQPYIWFEDFNNWNILMQSMKQLDDGEAAEVDL